MSTDLEMANVPGCLIWEIVKRNNAFRVKQFGNGNSRIEFSKEPNNLYNLNSFKYSGIVFYCNVDVFFNVYLIVSLTLRIGTDENCYNST